MRVVVFVAVLHSRTCSIDFERIPWSVLLCLSHDIHPRSGSLVLERTALCSSSYLATSQCFSVMILSCALAPWGFLMLSFRAKPPLTPITSFATAGAQLRISSPICYDCANAGTHTRYTRLIAQKIYTLTTTHRATLWIPSASRAAPPRTRTP